jgi:hypothetical protein
MNNSLFKSIVSATTNYFSHKPQSDSNTAQNQRPKSSFETPTVHHKLMAPDSTGRKQIFKDVVYYDASSSLDEEHRLALQNGGAVEYCGNGNVEWAKITHVFTRDVDFPGIQEAVKQQRLAIMTVFTFLD